MVQAMQERQRHRATTTKERPIIFSTALIPALLSGTKTQTRRIVKPVRGYEHNNVCRPDMAADPWAVWWHGTEERVGCLQSCPYGVPGDRLWVREAWRKVFEFPKGENILLNYRADPIWDGDKTPIPWKTPMFMPRWASRITLELIALRVERLQDISEEDAKAEGAYKDPCDHIRRTCDDIGCLGPWRAPFAEAWDKINSKRALWNSNPWVWVLEFRILQP